LKITSLSTPTAAIALLTAAVFAVATVAQAPQGPPPQGGVRPPRTYPAPTNLKVLPKDLTGQQVHEIMEGWAGSLGVHCDTCHQADPNNPGPNGRPRLKFEDDSKPEKQMARIMFTMTEDMKKNYIAKVAEMDKMGSPAPPLTCGTCHRGHLDPEAFVIPREEGPGRPEGPPPPAGAMPPMPPMQH
jgi:Photosynthetic reaction centre cytochrome C subunit